ncbi:MAG: FkbM family methyltransferase [Candidatus Sungiibacteriota bacterium]|uniref:FkbM family methyltransferase n=1 Tax=Candidatus Sungiibacteriota bacterium TaxID=2750080 RepID=A0A7T5RJS9_9BACT|nr:MAG: FkbM family methyltransferase [Candidatus Sungbacteria bacterium]
MLRLLIPKTLRRVLRLWGHNIKFMIEGSGWRPLSWALKGLGILDYAKRPLVMEVKSYSQLDHLKSCQREPETVAWLENNFRPGEILYDIGANVGAYSLIAWTVTAGQGRIYAFEPGFSTFDALVQNLILNKCGDKIIPLPVALADRTEIFYFHYSDISPGHALHELSDFSASAQRVPHPAFSQPMLGWRLDDFIEKFNLPHPTHLKIDVDGEELRVIKGAERTLASPTLKSLLIEINESLAGAAEIKERLHSAGLVMSNSYKRKRPQTFNYIFERKRGETSYF